VFTGTVKKLGAATMKNVPVTKQTATVHIDKVVEATKLLRRYEDHDITVQLSGARRVASGDQLLFHTDGWIFGEGLAVHSLAEEPSGPLHQSVLKTIVDPAQRLKERELQQHWSDADIVLSGTVSKVNPPADTADEAQGRAAAEQISGPVSEHDPHWREAVVNVEKVHKGRSSTEPIVVRFPSSMDVRWHKAPKFEVGQRGYFVLHKSEVGRGKAAATGKAKGAAPVAYTALHPLDFQPYDEPGGIKAMVAADNNDPK